MQRFIAKYGAALHLALLAVAPLALYPFCGEDVVATAVLWLVVPAAVWMLLEPSVREGEGFKEARHRVVRGIRTDPLFWTSVVISVLAGVRVANTGISLSYDAEASKWFVSEAAVPLFPGSCGSAGYFPFAATMAFAILLLGCRHALGRSARMAFLLSSSSFAGLAASVALLSTKFGDGAIGAMMGAEPSLAPFPGTAFGICLLGGTVALVAAFELKWHAAMPLFALAIGGNAIGVVAFAPVFVTVLFLAGELVLLAYGFAYASRRLHSAAQFKMLVVFGIVSSLGWLALALVLPENLMTARISAIVERAFFSEGYLKLRTVLSGVAFKSWLSHLWIGTGLGSFSLDFRFLASADDWLLIPQGASATANGWWLILAERGVVGLILLLLPAGFLYFTYFRRMFLWTRDLRLPHPASWIALLASAAVVTAGFFSASPLRAETLLIAGAMIAVSASSFPKTKGTGTHG